MNLATIALGGMLVILAPAVAPAADQPAPPAVRTWLYERRPDGRLTLMRDPAGRVTTLTYDDKAHLESIRYGDDETVRYIYSGQGLRESMTDSWGRTRYEYDPFGQLAAVHYPQERTLRYRFDLQQRLRRIELADWVLAYDYDLMGRLARVQTPLGRIDFLYEPARTVDGKPAPQSVRMLPNGVKTTWTFNADMQLAGLRHDRGSSVLAGWEYQRDFAGRIKAIKDLRTGVWRRYEYDPLGRLTQVLENERPVEEYQYDLGGNPVEIVRAGKSQEARHDEFGLLISAGGRRYAFDSAGAMIRREVAGSKPTVYRFSGSGRLAAVIDNGPAIEYRYDGDGNLVERRKGGASQQFVNDIAAMPSRPLAVYEGGKDPTMKYVLAPHRVAAQDRTGRAFYYLEDHLLSVRVVADSQGAVVARCDYSAFGNHESAATSPTEFGFTGQWSDPDTGLVHFQARWYEPETGRFISRDPRIGVLSEPSSLNRHVYAGGDPVNRTDPDGCAWIPPPSPPTPQPNLDWWLKQSLNLRQAVRVTQEEVKTETKFRGITIAVGVTDLLGIRGANRLLEKVGVALPHGLGNVIDYQVGLEFHKLGRPEFVKGPEILRTEFSRGFFQNFLREPKLGETIVEEATINANPFSFVPGLSLVNIDVTQRTERSTVLIPPMREAVTRLRESLPRTLPAFSIPTPPSTHVPNVGGVYLNGLASVLGDVGTLRGVHYDKARGMLAFLTDGPSRASKHLRVEDLAVAFQAALEDNWPGVSIDPLNDDPESKLMKYRYLGPTAQRRFGQVMGEADLLMKFIGMGEDSAEPRKKIRPRIDGFRDYLELSFDLHSAQKNRVYSRFWLVPGQIEWQMSPDGKTLWCKTAEIKVNTQVEEVVGGRLVDAVGRSEPAADAFARSFSQHYDELAREYPIYQDLRELAALVGLAKWLRGQMAPEEFARLAASFVPVVRETPETTPTLHVVRTRETRAGTILRTQQLAVSGGVNLSPPPPKISQDPSLDWIGPKNSVPAAIPTRPARTEFDVSGRRVQALSIPPLARISLGHFALGATDLSIPTGEGQALSLTRHYHSSLTSAGPLGRGWHLSLPQVRMERRGPHCTLYLTDTLQTYRQKLGVVDAGSLITSLNNGKVIDFRGDADTRWYFGPERRLTRCKVGNDEWTYDYDGVKLRRLSFTHQGQTVASIDLDYNADGLIAAARDNQGHTVRFRYDTQQRLVGVTGSAGSTEYSYTDDHRLASVHSPSGSRNFRYDAAGNLTADVDGAGQGLTYRRQPTGDGGIRVETIDPSGQGTDVFFDPFGIVSRLQRQGRVLDRTHEGAVEVLTLKTGDASLAQMRYDPSARTIDNLVPGESSEHVELDANGVPRRSTIESTVDGSRMAVEYGDDGKPVRMTDPAGGEYRLLEAGNRQQESVTPSGTYRITSDEQGRRIRLELPSGKVREWGYSDARATEPVAVAERGPQDVHQWQSRKPNHWELSANNEPVSMLSTDEHGRVLSLQAPSGATVKAQHGAGGSVVRLPDHRQVVIRRNASGQIVEVRELPRNSPPAAMPVEDLVGKSKAQQLVRPLGRLRKEK